MVHNSKHDNADIGMDFAYVVNEEENYPCENYSNQRNFAIFICTMDKVNFICINLSRGEVCKTLSAKVMFTAREKSEFTAHQVSHTNATVVLLCIKNAPICNL